MTDAMTDAAADAASSATAATEATLCRILADVLQVDLVRPQDGFFEVGGDSVLAVQVVARAREASVVFTVRDLFDHQTAETLAAVIDARFAATGAGRDAVDSAESPPPTFADGEFGEFGEFGDFDDVETGRDAGGTEGEWEIIT